MIDSINKLTTKYKIIQKFLLTIILAVFLMTSFALPSQPALAGNLPSIIKNKLKRKNKVAPSDVSRQPRQDRQRNLQSRNSRRSVSRRSGSRRSGSHR